MDLSHEREFPKSRDLNEEGPPSCLPASAKEAGIQAEKQALPVTIIADGHLYPKNLAAAKKDLAWVNKVLQARKTDIRDTFLLTVDGRDQVFFLGKEDVQ